MIAATVQPLGAWLSRRFRPDEAATLIEELRTTLDSLLAFRPTWNDEGGLRSATAFSFEGFSRPFELARQGLKLPRLRVLEPPQIWLPVEFEPVFRIAAPWNPETKVQVASCEGVRGELARLVPEIQDREALGAAKRLLTIAEEAVEAGLPVIIEV